MEYVRLGGAALLQVAVAIALYLLDKKTKFGRLDEKKKQLLYGVAFGILAILGTEVGIPVNGAQTNCRDASVLIAGLLFGAPAGIIAGLIGGVERWIAVWWGVGAFTRVACSVSTIIAGFYAALLRKYLFEDKKPGTFIAFAIGIVMEVFHLTMVFITNMGEPEKAMAVVKACTVPMLLANGISVMLAALAISLIGRDRTVKKTDRVRISQTIQRWLLVAVVLAFFATSYFVYQLQDTIALTQTDSLLSLGLEDVSADITDAAERTGLATGASREDLDAQIISFVKNRHIGKTGYLLVLDSDYQLINSTQVLDLSEWENKTPPEENTTFLTGVDEESCYCRYLMAEGYCIVAVLPAEEALQMRNIALYVNTFMEILVFAVLFGLIYLLIKRVVVNQIQSVNASLAKITGGDLNEVVNVRSNEEFASLSDDINSTVDTLKRYIAEASARIDQELEFAKNIQASALPSTFPAFPKRKDFDIFASMNPAKEVGGDFYDFYLTDNDNLHFLIADVSGKGIPAAMFMMRAKTELKSLTEASLPIGEVFTKGNAALCEGNDAGMFVTAWQGGIDLTTGKVQFVNAGHNPPLVRHKDGKFEYLKSKVGFVLAGMDCSIYRMQELQLEPGDTIYLYTDGVTEAQNAAGELFGEDRLLDTINKKEFADMKDLCESVKADVNAFVGDAPQFDDITMVGLKYIGTPPAPSIHFDEAKLDDIPVVTEFLEGEMEKAGCPMKVVTQIDIAVDELFSNIVRYGYPKKPGPVTVKFIEKEDPHRICIQFCDEGVPYNPLTKEDPDVTLSAEERGIGGLGIYMVKKSMDDMKYRYENGFNILTIIKNL